MAKPAKKAAAAKPSPKTTAAKKPAAKKAAPARTKAKAATKPAPPAPEAPPMRAMPLRDATLPIGSLFASVLNPRKSMDEAGLRELADSIVANGILQPLLVRPGAYEWNRYEIILGARRYTAAMIAVQDGRLAEDFPVPVRIREATDAELLELAMTENLQRKDMDPLDEAQGYAALLPHLGGPRAIGQRLGVPERTVHRRLALLRLAPEAQALVRSGILNLQQAAAFSLGDVKTQVKHLAEIGRNAYLGEPAHIRRVMTKDRIPVARAYFPESRYTGEILEDPESHDRFFADIALFERLQEEAIAEKVESLKSKWKFVDRLKDAGKAYRYGEATKGSAKAGAIVYVDYSGKLVVKTGLLRPGETEAIPSVTALDAPNAGSSLADDAPDDVDDDELAGGQGDDDAAHHDHRSSMRNYRAQEAAREQRRAAIRNILADYPAALSAAALLQVLIEADVSEGSTLLLAALAPIDADLRAALELAPDDSLAEVLDAIDGSDEKIHAAVYRVLLGAPERVIRAMIRACDLGTVPTLFVDWDGDETPIAGVLREYAGVSRPEALDVAPDPDADLDPDIDPAIAEEAAA